MLAGTGFENIFFFRTAFLTAAAGAVKSAPVGVITNGSIVSRGCPRAGDIIRRTAAFISHLKIFGNAGIIFFLIVRTSFFMGRSAERGRFLTVGIVGNAIDNTRAADPGFAVFTNFVVT